MENIKMLDLHQYILNEGIEEIQSKTKHFQSLLSVLPNGDKLQKDFSSVITNILRPGIEHRHGSISFIKSLIEAVEGYLGRIGLSFNVTLLYPLNLFKLGVVATTTVMMKIFEILMMGIRFVEHKNITKEEFEDKLKKSIKELKRSYH